MSLGVAQDIPPHFIPLGRKVSRLLSRNPIKTSFLLFQTQFFSTTILIFTYKSQYEMLKKNRSLVSRRYFEGKRGKLKITRMLEKSFETIVISYWIGGSLGW